MDMEYCISRKLIIEIMSEFEGDIAKWQRT